MLQAGQGRDLNREGAKARRNEKEQKMILDSFAPLRFRGSNGFADGRQ